jgi:hypothetical protein
MCRRQNPPRGASKARANETSLKRQCVRRAHDQDAKSKEASSPTAVLLAWPTGASPLGHVPSSKPSTWCQQIQDQCGVAQEAARRAHDQRARWSGCAPSGAAQEKSDASFSLTKDRRAGVVFYDEGFSDRACSNCCSTKLHLARILIP